MLDQGPLWETGGSTSHAPGLVFQLNPSRTMTQMARWTTELLGGVAVGGEPCFYPVGGIEVATDEARLAELDRRWGRAQGFGLTDARLLTPAEVAEQIPLLDPSRILGGLVVASDGIAKGVRAAEALGRASGAHAFGGCEVIGLRHRARARARRADHAGRHRRRSRRARGRHLGRQGRPARRTAAADRAAAAPVRAVGAAGRAGGRDARGRAPDPAPPGPLDVLPPARRPLRRGQLPPRAAADRAGGHPRAGRRAAAVDPRLHALGLRRRGARGGRACCRRCGARATSARSTG